MHLELLDSLTLPGDAAKPNEDSFTASSVAACVFDGATGLGDRLMPGRSDAQWIAQFGARRFRAYAEAGEGAIRDWLRGAASDAETSEVFGAAWVRLLRGENRGYGYVDDDTAELCIAVVPQQRNKQIGTELLTQLFRMAQQHYSAISLSVAAENPAMRLYQRLGFQTVSSHAGTVVMKKRFHGI